MPQPLPHTSPLPPGFQVPTQTAAADLPLHGLTLLAVEDSRYACEALRLMCQRAGARLRRADTLATARAHLRLYRPDVVIVDLGLPDGRGEALIRDLVLSPRRPAVVLGTSGDTMGRGSALAAGADGFLDKPLESLSYFCETLRTHLPGLGIATDAPLAPDPLALHDDLMRAASELATNPDAARQRYATGFITGLARHAHDGELAAAAGYAAHDPQNGIAPLRRIIAARLSQPADAFQGG